MLSAKLNPSTSLHRQSSVASLCRGNRVKITCDDWYTPIECLARKRYQLLGNSRDSKQSPDSHENGLKKKLAFLSNPNSPGICGFACKRGHHLFDDQKQARLEVPQVFVETVDVATNFLNYIVTEAVLVSRVRPRNETAFTYITSSEKGQSRKISHQNDCSPPLY
ncbi:hypothetical protein TNCV_358791 [Trichonephila clavipes]|nr:hypothetical protein TNCV_358791 [Trichonephila clavipes]